MIMITSCATVPIVRDWRPWYRIDGKSNIINVGSKIKLDLVSSNKVLIGSDSLEKEIIKKNINNLLKRKGYEVVNENQDYTLSITYDISKIDQLNMQTSYGSSSFGSISNAYGVNTAYLISSRSNFTETKINSSAGYYNVLSVESFNKNNDIIWKGNAIWESNSIEIENGIYFAIKVLMSDLPKKQNNINIADEVKESHALNYLNVNGLYPFSSPGVPYKIYILDPLNIGVIQHYFPSNIADKKIIAACFDMITNAEYALPNGGLFTDYSNPLDKGLWGKLQLGGQYLIGEKMTNVLIDLNGKDFGYKVDNCKIASDEDYKNYMTKLTLWEKSLADFYDFYKTSVR